MASKSSIAKSKDPGPFHRATKGTPVGALWWLTDTILKKNMDSSGIQFVGG